MKTVEKKCWPKNFELFATGKRILDFRLADFDLEQGDMLVLTEYDPEKKKLTGRTTQLKVKRLEKVGNITRYYSEEELEKHGFYLMLLD